MIGGPALSVAGGDASEFSLPTIILDCVYLVVERGMWPEGGGVIALEGLARLFATVELRCGLRSGEGVRGLAMSAILPVRSTIGAARDVNAGSGAACDGVFPNERLVMGRLQSGQ